MARQQRRSRRRAAFRNALALGLTGAVAAAALSVATLVPGAGTSPGGGVRSSPADRHGACCPPAADETHAGKSSGSDTLILGVGWTNEKPHKPSLP